MCLSRDMPACTLLTAPHSSCELNYLMHSTQPVCRFVVPSVGALTSCVSEARQKLTYQWLWWAGDPYGQRDNWWVCLCFSEPPPHSNDWHNQSWTTTAMCFVGMAPLYRIMALVDQWPGNKMSLHIILSAIFLTPPGYIKIATYRRILYWLKYVLFYCFLMVTWSECLF